MLFYKGGGPSKAVKLSHTEEMALTLIDRAAVFGVEGLVESEEVLEPEQMNAPEVKLAATIDMALENDQDEDGNICPNEITNVLVMFIYEMYS